MHGHNNNVRKEGRKERKKERKKERRGRLKKNDKYEGRSFAALSEAPLVTRG